ncbi:hypothetical protein QTP70_000915 [Hemibagrus guttatus]|uniref:Transposase Tc1-like domain-containing protein n=1 Tax=Hemibagrus guttatus TaxID=175788 RepID=A0AAE0PWN3_9TELE|nr:hypothetical protein QTP70_000915 [Hemibagrus guttatus]
MPLDTIQEVGERRMVAKLSSLLENDSHPLYDTVKSLSSSFSDRLFHPKYIRFRESGTISVCKGQGRKTILDARDLQALRRHCITYRNATVMEITTWAQEYFQKTLSVNTIHRAIRRRRLKLYRSKKKPYLNMIQKCRRFLWAKAHLKWTVAKWTTVLWSDQSKFEVLLGKLGRYVIRIKEDKDNPSCYLRSVQKPASLMPKAIFTVSKWYHDLQWSRVSSGCPCGTILAATNGSLVIRAPSRVFPFFHLPIYKLPIPPTFFSHDYIPLNFLRGVGLGPLVSVKGTLNASAYKDILDNFMLPTLWEQFGDDPFLFQHDCTPVTKSRSIKTWMSEFGAEELDWSAQSPDLNPIEQL